MRRLPALLLVLALGACGGGSTRTYPSKATVVGPLGKGADGVWLFQPAGKPKNVVIFFHGQGSPAEATPVNHRPWINHLVSRGSAVVYPRWELTDVVDPTPAVVAGVRTAMHRLGKTDVPVLAIGYSRGGGLVVEYGALAKQYGLPVPNAIMSVFPGCQGDEGKMRDLSHLDHRTALLIQIGEDDTVVDGAGARCLLGRLQKGGFPGKRVQLDIVRTQPGLTADHFAPLQTTPAAKAEFWATADRELHDLDAAS